ncbi:protein jagged-2-like isoform X2 [Stegostoma tigrinum]|uniref:protein jagged-2-like isoform X2 n=1 Tax=Stegostoma tigrinum TaxID=3053191 RepID=UPI00286FD558|nr:protein jagged-2-like isoform X2 [Stegostoma tigrinum]
MWINIFTILFTSGYPFLSESVVYRLQRAARSFETSRAYCTWLFDGLSEIYNENLQRYLSSVARGKEVWIGVSKCNSNWCYSGTGKMVSYTNWAKGEPNNYYSFIFGEENCVLMRSSSKWNDENCSAEYYFMCQELHCKATTCNRRGTCVELAGGFRCYCDHSFYGSNCENEKCKATSCNKRGRCVELSNGFSCICDQGFYGNNCENEKCKATSCNRRGRCVELSHGFSCICDQGFYGNNCENEKCKATSCSRRGTCVELVYGFRCFCQHGFYGKNCENVISCPIITIPDHSMVNCDGLYGKNHFQAVCTFTCERGFILNGSNSTICQASGSWTTYNTNCQGSTNHLKPVLISVGGIAMAPLILSVICWWKRRKSQEQNNTSDDFPMQQKTVAYENQDIYSIPSPHLNNDIPQEEIYVNLSM